VHKLVATLVLLLVGSVLSGTPAAADSAPWTPWAPSTVYAAPDRALFDASPTTVSRGVTFHWEDGYPEDARFDVRVSRTPARAVRRAPWVEPTSRHALPTARTHLTLRPGTVLCVQVRSRDAADHTSPWSEAECISRAFKASQLRSHGPVTVVHGERFWQGQARVVRYGGSLTLSGVRRGTSDVLFVTVPTDERALAWKLPGQPENVTFSGHGHRAGHTQVVHYTTRAARTGTLRFTTGGAARSLPLEGVALMPRWMFD
jgi:hypothetical protein